MNVFVDSGAWIALVYEDDAHHPHAKAYYRSCLSQRVQFFTSNYVLAETYTWLRYRISHRRALQFHQIASAAEQQGLLRILWVDRAVAEAAWQIFARYDDQVFSIADCTSFVLARRMGVDEVFAFDDDFRTMGFLVRP